MVILSASGGHPTSIIYAHASLTTCPLSPQGERVGVRGTNGTNRTNDGPTPPQNSGVPPPPTTSSSIGGHELHMTAPEHPAPHKPRLLVTPYPLPTTHDPSSVPRFRV